MLIDMRPPPISLLCRYMLRRHSLFRRDAATTAPRPRYGHEYGIMNTGTERQ